jgi:hypothetical protein
MPKEKDITLTRTAYEAAMSAIATTAVPSYITSSKIWAGAMATTTAATGLGPAALEAPRVVMCYQTRIKPEIIAGILLNRISELPLDSYLACRGNPKGQTDDMVSIMAMSLGAPTTVFATANIPGVRTVTAFERDALLARYGHCGIFFLHEEDEGTAVAATPFGGTLNVMHQMRMLDKPIETWFVNDAGDAVRIGSSDDINGYLMKGR